MMSSSKTISGIDEGNWWETSRIAIWRNQTTGSRLLSFPTTSIHFHSWSNWKCSKKRTLNWNRVLCPVLGRQPDDTELNLSWCSHGIRNRVDSIMLTVVTERQVSSSHISRPPHCLHSGRTSFDTGRHQHWSQCMSVYITGLTRSSCMRRHGHVIWIMSTQDKPEVSTHWCGHLYTPDVRRSPMQQSCRPACDNKTTPFSGKAHSQWFLMARCCTHY